MAANESVSVPRVRKLFISYSGLIRHLRDEKVTTADLEDGIFYFGCVREHVMHPEQSERNDSKEAMKRNSSDARRQIHENIVSAALTAEMNGRIGYRLFNEPNSYEVLASLLEENGYIGFPLESSADRCVTGYNYPEIVNRVKDAGFDLEVIY